MKKKTLYKILAVFFIIGLLIPTIVIAANPNMFSVKTDKKIVEYVQMEQDSEDIDQEMMLQFEELQTMPFEANMRGRWGVYDTYIDGTWNGYKYQNEIYGRVVYESPSTSLSVADALVRSEAFFYLILNQESKAFKGILMYNGDFHRMHGEYLNDDGDFVAMWHIMGYDGWFTGSLI